MNNFKDQFQMSLNFIDNFYLMKQKAILEAQLNEAKKKGKKPEKKADKDYDGDGKVESGTKEYLDSRSKAIEQAMAKKKGKKIEESFEADLTEVELVEELLEEVFGDDFELVEKIILEKKKWIQQAIKKENSLRKSMKTKKGEKIPVSKLEKAAKKGGKTGKRARLALTLRKLNEDVAWTDDYLPGNEKMSGIGVKELQKILAGGGSPVLGTGQNASPEIIAAAKMHLDAVTKGPSPEQAKSAYHFFKQNFPHMGVEDEIGVMHNIADHTPVKSDNNFPKTEYEMKKR